jgi:lipoprotein-anchoring transpeptidase ErfK/SrfK
MTLRPLCSHKEVQFTLGLMVWTVAGLPCAAFAQAESVGTGLQLMVQQPYLVTPALPNLPDATLYLPQNSTISLLLKLSHRKVYVYEGDKVIATYPVAIGRPEFPTPTGEFEIFEMIVNPSWQNPWTGEVETPGADGSLGLRWIGFTQVEGGVIGFHGTPNVASIGRAASHGCVRMRNEDVVKLYEKVQLGTMVRVEQ